MNNAPVSLRDRGRSRNIFAVKHLRLVSIFSPIVYTHEDLSPNSTQSCWGMFLSFVLLMFYSHACCSSCSSFSTKGDNCMSLWPFFPRQLFNAIDMHIDFFCLQPAMLFACMWDRGGEGVTVFTHGCFLTFHRVLLMKCLAPQIIPQPVSTILFHLFFKFQIYFFKLQIFIFEFIILLVLHRLNFESIRSTESWKAWYHLLWRTCWWGQRARVFTTHYFTALGHHNLATV